MAASVTTQNNALGAKVVEDTAATATAVTNVIGSSGTLYYVEVDNTNNSAASYFKVYNATGPTVGTTAPDLILRAPASTREYFVFPTGIAFATAISYACVTAAGTGGTGSPSSSVTIRMLAG